MTPTIKKIIRISGLLLPALVYIYWMHIVLYFTFWFFTRIGPSKDYIRQANEKGNNLFPHYLGWTLVLFILSTLYAYFFINRKNPIQISIPVTFIPAVYIIAVYISFWYDYRNIKTTIKHMDGAFRYHCISDSVRIVGGGDTINPPDSFKHALSRAVPCGPVKFASYYTLLLTSDICDSPMVYSVRSNGRVFGPLFGRYFCSEKDIISPYFRKATDTTQ